METRNHYNQRSGTRKAIRVRKLKSYIMSERTIGKKFVITDKNLVINGSLGSSKVIPRDEVKQIISGGNIFLGIINCLLIFNIVVGIKMLMGKKRVTIKRKYGSDHICWAEKEEVDELKKYI